MAPSVLEGDNLGEKHRNLNKLVKEAIGSNRVIDPKVDKGDGDIENLLKIDIANHEKDVAYILEVLKSEDIVYVSRALKRCHWLVTDPQHASIIDPEHLHTQLFPHMTPKATCKLLLHIRLHLRDEAMVERFFNYYKEDNFKTALKWLPGCSVPFIEDITEKHTGHIPIFLLKRLCEKTPTVFDKYIQNYDGFLGCFLKSTLFLLNTHGDKYLDTILKLDYYKVPNFGKKFTKLLMEKYSARVMENFDKFATNIDVNVFAKYIKKEDIKTLILTHITNKKLHSFFTFDNLKSLIKRMPKEGRFEFIKQVFIDEKHKKSCTDSDNCSTCNLRARLQDGCISPAENIYRWYQYADFDIAFSELKKCIRSESSQRVKIRILETLVHCANRNMTHIEALLQYYHDKHNRDPIDNKLRFVNNVISETHVHKYNENAWNTLNSIFKNMDIYEKSTCLYGSLIPSVIVIYNILHDIKVPEILEEKLDIHNLKDFQEKLDEEQQDKVFGYLYNITYNKIQSKDTAIDNQFQEAVAHLKDMLCLLSGWKKELSEFPSVLDKIKEYIQIKFESSIKDHLSDVYERNKSWRRCLFVESLLIRPTEEVCLNILKHDPFLLSQHQKEVESIRCNDGMSLRRLLNKLRVYWPQTLAREWADAYQGRLNVAGNHKAVARGICFVMPLTQVINIVQRYTPKQAKIKWDEADALELGLQKNFAKNMHLARPQPSPDIILGYAKGDYLQYALPSLHAIYYNLKPVDSRGHILKLLDTPVSLQKHGIRIAFTKLKGDDLKIIFADTWKTTKNATIRAVLFKLTHNLLCREKNSNEAKQIWNILDVFLENLTFKEDEKIYDLLSQVENIPLIVRASYLMKSYRFIKKMLLATGKSYEDLYRSIHKLALYTREVMQYVDSGFVVELLQEFIDEKFLVRQFDRYKYESLINVISAYVLCAKDEDTQMQKYEKLLLPLLKRCIELWNKSTDENHFVRYNTYQLLNCLSSDLKCYVVKEKMIIPVKMFECIQTELEKSLTVQENYIPLTKWKLTVALTNLLEGKIKTYENTSEENIWDNLSAEIVPMFGEKCLLQLKADVTMYFPLIYVLFARAIEQLKADWFSENIQWVLCKSILQGQDCIQAYLVTIKLFPQYHICDPNYENENARNLREIIRAHPSVEVKMHYYQTFQSD